MSQPHALVTALSALLAASACGGKAVVDPPLASGAGGSGTTTTASATTGVAATSGAGGASCDGQAPATGTLCIRGEIGPDGLERLSDSAPIRFEARPAGCFSSTCTTVREARCNADIGSIDADSTVALTTAFCLASGGDVRCTDDCGGGGLASCEAGPLPNGGYNVTDGPLTILFTVPMQLPAGGLCTEALF